MSNTLSYSFFDAAFEIVIQTQEEGGGQPNPVLTPSNLSVTEFTSTEVTLTWVDNSTNEDNFVVERSTSATVGFNAVATLPANSTSFTNTGLNPNTTYYYRLKAINATSNSDYSTTVNVTTTSTQASSYTISQLTGNFYLSTLNNVNTGQSITTQGAGEIVEVRFRLYSAVSNATLQIYLGNTVSGTPAYTQAVATSSGGWQTFTLTTPFSVNANTQYTIRLTNASIAYRAANVYSGGHLWYNTIAYTGFDAAFEVVIVENTNKVAAASTPMSEDTNCRVYPNPCSDWLIVEYAGNFEVNVYDNKGTLHIQEKGIKQQIKIRLANLPRGVFYVLIKDKDKTIRKKVIIE